MKVEQGERAFRREKDKQRVHSEKRKQQFELWPIRHSSCNGKYSTHLCMYVYCVCMYAQIEYIKFEFYLCC